MNSLDCPFAERDFGAVYNYLVDIPLHRLIILTQQVMAELSPIEALNYNINKFCQRYDDRQGRIAFLKKLVEDNIIVPLQYPFDVLRDPELSKLLSTAHYSMQFPFGETEDVAKEEVLTDELEVVSGPINVTNPRWEHKKEAEDKVEDEEKVKVEKSADRASFGDTIILMADVTGIPESAPVTFDIYDTSEDPPMVINSAKGKNDGGVAKGKWVVTDKSGKGTDQTLAFEAVAKSKVSTRCTIILVECMKKNKFGFIKICCTNALTSELLSNADCTLKGLENEFSGKTDENGVLLLKNIPLDTYSLCVNVNGKLLQAMASWKRNGETVQVLRMKQD